MDRVKAYQSNLATLFGKLEKAIADMEVATRDLDQHGLSKASLDEYFEALAAHAQDLDEIVERVKRMAQKHW